ncbi:MAG: RNA polymerase sigma factor SigZ [Nitrospirota bacterium]
MKGASIDPPAERPSTDTVWAAFADPVRQFIRRRVGDDADADDILQMVFIKIHAGLGGLADTERLPAWIYQIARHTVIDHLRRRASGPAAVELPDDLAAEVQEPASAVEELAGCVRPLIDRLPEPYRRALTLTEIEGRTQRELAEALGLSLSGAKSRVQRGREQVKAMLLACCHVELDRYGRVIDYEPRPDCRDCASCDSD